MATALAIATTLLQQPRPARAETGSDASVIAARFVSDINALRQAHGLAPYGVSSQLADLALAWSRRQAAAGDVFHNLDMYATLSGRDWSRLNENVGMGPSQEAVEAAFEASPDHVANYLNARYTHVGVGVVVTASGGLFVTEDFGQAAAHAAVRTRAATEPRAAAPVPPAPPAPPVTAPGAATTPTSPGPAPARVILVLEQLRRLDNTG